MVYTYNSSINEFKAILGSQWVSVSANKKKKFSENLKIWDRVHLPCCRTRVCRGHLLNTYRKSWQTLLDFTGFLVGLCYFVLPFSTLLLAHPLQSGILRNIPCSQDYTSKNSPFVTPLDYAEPFIRINGFSLFKREVFNGDKVFWWENAIFYIKFLF